MTLTPGTDTYATLAEYTAYAALYGWALETDAADNEINLRKGKRALDLMYIWRDGYPNETVDAIKHAQIELAYAIQGGADPLARIDGGAVVSKSEAIDGAVSRSVTYKEASARDRVAFPAVDALVAGYVIGKAGQVGASIRLVRG